jgi:flagella basal body P-ring formation protein FlgA
MKKGTKTLHLLKNLSMFYVTAFFCFGCISIFAQSKAVIHISAETTISGDRITLGDIAEVSGANKGTVNRLKTVSLGYAPNVGMTREISRPQIALAVSAAGFSDNEVALNSPEKILVRRAGQEISDSQIREAIEKSILDQFSTDKISAQIIRLDLPEKIQVAVGKVEIRVNISGIRNLFTRFSLPVEIRVDSKTVRSFAATLEIEAFAEVFVAAKDLSANVKISEIDVRLEKRRLEKPITNYLRDAEKLRGAMLIKNVASGAEITTDSFVAAVVIKFGDSVRIEAQSGNLKIILNGEARSSGKIGDRISVKNLQSKAILQAVVIDEGLVKIIF